MAPTSPSVADGRGEGDVGACLQALRERIVRQERHGGRPPALRLQDVRAQLHGDAAPRQAAGDEGAGGPPLRPGQRQPGDDRQAARGEPRRGPQMDQGGRRGGAGALDHAGRQHRADRRDVALREREKNKVWLWRAFDPVARRTLAWELGGRDDATCERLLDKIGLGGKIFLTDDWEGFHRLIPEEQHFTGKDLTFGIEQDNGDVRHHLARFRRRSKVTSRPPPPPPPPPAPQRSPRFPATWSTAPSGCSATCASPRTSCRYATASYLSLVKCLLARSAPACGRRSVGRGSAQGGGGARLPGRPLDRPPLGWGGAGRGPPRG